MQELIVKKLFLVLFLMSFFNSKSQSFDCGTSTVTDADGNLYHTVQIGSQCWMKENMRTTKYSNGQAVGIPGIIGSKFYETINMKGKLQVIVHLTEADKISTQVYDMSGRLVKESNLYCDAGNTLLDFFMGPTGYYIVQIKSKKTESNFEVMGGEQADIEISVVQNTSSNLKSKSDTIVLSHFSRYCFDYDNDPANTEKFGKLYTSLSALNVDSTHYGHPIQGVCPDNWHVATDNDWVQLEITAGMDSNEAINGIEYFRGNISNKLKSIGLEYWDPNFGTDDFGFSARGSGLYSISGNFNEGWGFFYLTQSCCWWTYRPYQDHGLLMLRELTDISRGVFSGFTYDNWALSVRCIRNQ